MAKPIVVELKNAFSGTRTKDPYDPNKYELTVLVPASQIVKLNPYFANPRDGYVSEPSAKHSSVAKDIRNTLTNEPATFHEKNLGVTVIADSAELKSETKSLTITFSNSEFLRDYAADPNNRQQIRGVANGGTTIGVIADAIENEEYLEDGEAAYVRLNVRCGSLDREDVTDIVGPLNNNKQLSKFELNNYGGEFDALKEVLSTSNIGGIPFPKVAYFTGDSGVYQIEELVQLLSLMTRQDADSGDNVPYMAYSGIAGCLGQYLSEKDRLTKFHSFLPSIVKLHEFIQSRAPEVYNTGKTKFFALGLFTKSQLSKGVETPFMRYPLKTKVNNSWTFPLLAAFIPLIKETSSGVKWSQDPEKVFEAVGKKMITTLNESAETFKSRQNALGRDPNTYAALQGLVLMELAKNK